MQTSKYPVCNSDVIVDDDSFQGDLVSCANCQNDLELTSLHPPELNEIEDTGLENQ